MHPILFHWQGQPVFTYGLAIVVGALLGGVWAWRSCPAGLFTLPQYLNLCILTTIGAAFGARWAAAGAIGSAGELSSLGVPLAVGPLVAAYCRLAGLDWLGVFDHLLPFAVFGAAFQRVFGCFAAGCCAGLPTELPWGVPFDGGPVGVHPTQLYLGLAFWLSFAVSVRYRGRRAGEKSLLALGLYGLGSALVSPFRAGLGPATWLGLTSYAWVHLLVAVVSLGWAIGLARSVGREAGIDSVRPETGSR